MKHIIFISSEGGNVGKTTTALNYSNYLNNKNIPARPLSFATPVKHYCNSLFSTLFPSSPKTFTEFFSDRSSKEDKISNYVDFGPVILEEEETFRSFINNVSDDFKSKYGKSVWANIALNTILNSDESVLVFDDFRTTDEYNYVKENLPKKYYHTTTIKLMKDGDDIITKSSYESLLKDFEHDIDFKFESDYSNLNKLFNLLDLSRLNNASQ